MPVIIKENIKPMSNYDYRDKPAYRAFTIEPHRARNKHILKWWTSNHDDLMSKLIEQEQWQWYWYMTDSIVANTEKTILDKWKEEDPLCLDYAWYNILMYFAKARAETLGLTKRIRKPEWKKCRLCDNNFVEDSLPVPLVKKFGVNRLDYCSPCLRDTVAFNAENAADSNLSKQETIVYLQNLTEILGSVPPQNFDAGKIDFHDMDDERRLFVLKALQNRPTIKRVKELFGSWLHALIEAGVLEDGTRRTPRGIQTIAKDGHVCLSLGEKTIDDFLFSHGVPHEREPRYPEGNYRGDFLVDEVFIEYFGLKGNPDYDAKTKLKQKLCKKHKIQLISIYPSDLVSTKKLERKLTPILNIKSKESTL